MYTVKGFEKYGMFCFKVVNVETGEDASDIFVGDGARTDANKLARDLNQESFEAGVAEGMMSAAN